MINFRMDIEGALAVSNQNFTLNLAQSSAKYIKYFKYNHIKPKISNDSNARDIYGLPQNYTSLNGTFVMPVRPAPSYSAASANRRTAAVQRR